VERSASRRSRTFGGFLEAHDSLAGQTLALHPTRGGVPVLGVHEKEVRGGQIGDQDIEDPVGFGKCRAQRSQSLCCARHGVCLVALFRRGRRQRRRLLYLVIDYEHSRDGIHFLPCR
jgi:hypothetical protein